MAGRALRDPARRAVENPARRAETTARRAWPAPRGRA